MTDQTVSASAEAIPSATPLHDAAIALEAREAADAAALAEAANPKPKAPEEPEEAPKEDEGEPAEDETEADAEKRRQRPGKNAREIARLREENRALQEAVARNAPKPPAQTPTAESPPRREDFQSDEAFLDARVAHGVKQGLAQHEQRQREEAARQAQANAEAAFAERTAKAREKLPDFDDVALDPAVPISEIAAQLIRHSDVGPEIAYQLGSDLAEARRIAGLPPLLQARELGKIEARLEAKSAPAPKAAEPAKPKAKAAAPLPEPVKPIGGTETVTVDPDKLSDSQWQAWRNKTKTIR